MNEFKEVFLKHEGLFNMLIVDCYIPQGSNNAVIEIKDAYEKLTGAKTDMNCSQCVISMLKNANRYRLAYIDELNVKKSLEERIEAVKEETKETKLAEPDKLKWYEFNK